MILKYYKPMQPRIKWFSPIKVNPTRVEEIQPTMPKFNPYKPEYSPEVTKEESTSSDED